MDSAEELGVDGRAGVPPKRYGTTNEIAFLGEDGAVYITGQNIRVDGGAIRSV